MHRSWLFGTVAVIFLVAIGISRNYKHVDPLVEIFSEKRTPPVTTSEYSNEESGMKDVGILGTLISWGGLALLGFMIYAVVQGISQNCSDAKEIINNHQEQRSAEFSDTKTPKLLNKLTLGRPEHKSMEESEDPDNLTEDRKNATGEAGSLTEDSTKPTEQLESSTEQSYSATEETKELTELSTEPEKRIKESSSSKSDSEWDWDQNIGPNINRKESARNNSYMEFEFESLVQYGPTKINSGTQEGSRDQQHFDEFRGYFGKEQQNTSLQFDLSLQNLDISGSSPLKRNQGEKQALKVLQSIDKSTDITPSESQVSIGKFQPIDFGNFSIVSHLEDQRDMEKYHIRIEALMHLQEKLALINRSLAQKEAGEMKKEAQNLGAGDTGFPKRARIHSEKTGINKNHSSGNLDNIRIPIRGKR